MMDMRVSLLEAYFAQLPRMHALDDLRTLDLLVASQGKDGYTTVRERLMRVQEKGMAAIDRHGRLVITPEEAAAERARLRAFLAGA